MLPFSVDLRDGEPVSDQVVRAARRALVTGELRAGDLFPSVRQIAQDLRISPTTAQKVIHQLKDLGLLASRPGVGTVVSIAGPPSLEERMVLLEPSCVQLLGAASDLQLTLGETLEAVRRTAESTGSRGDNGTPVVRPERASSNDVRDEESDETFPDPASE